MLNKLKEKKIMTNLKKTTQKICDLKHAIQFAEETLSLMKDFSYLTIYRDRYGVQSKTISKSNCNNVVSKIQKLGIKLLNKEIKELEKQIEFVFNNKIEN